MNDEELLKAFKMLSARIAVLEALCANLMSLASEHTPEESFELIVSYRPKALKELDAELERVQKVTP